MTAKTRNQPNKKRTEPCEVLLPANIPIRVGRFSFGLLKPTWVLANMELVELLRAEITESGLPEPELPTRSLRSKDSGTRRKPDGQKAAP